LTQHPARDPWPEDRLPGGHRVDRPDDLVLGGALQQVAGGAGAHRVEQRVLVVDHRQHQHRRPRRVHLP